MLRSWRSWNPSSPRFAQARARRDATPDSKDRRGSRGALRPFRCFWRHTAARPVAARVLCTILMVPPRRHEFVTPWPAMELQLKGFQGRSERRSGWPGVAVRDADTTRSWADEAWRAVSDARTSDSPPPPGAQWHEWGQRSRVQPWRVSCARAAPLTCSALYSRRRAAIADKTTA